MQRITSRPLHMVIAATLTLLLAIALVPAVAAIQGGGSVEFAHAASSVNATLKAGKTYSSYDVTGDGKADSVKVQAGGTYVNVYVNGKHACQLKLWSGGAIGARYLKLQNGTPFVAVVENGEGNEEGMARVLKWKGGKLASVLDCNALGNAVGVGTHLYPERLKASGNKIVCTYEFNYTSAGVLNFKYSYAYKGGKLVRTSKTSFGVELGPVGASSRNATANGGVRLYSNAGCTKKASKVSGDASVTLKKIYIAGKICALQVKASGKTGWVKVKGSNSAYGLLFRESFNAA